MLLKKIETVFLTVRLPPAFYASVTVEGSTNPHITLI